MFISRFVELFFSCTSFGVLQKSRLRAASDVQVLSARVPGPFSVAGAEANVVYVYTAAQLCFIKELNPTCLSSLSDTHIQQTNGFTDLLHTLKKL